MARGRMISKDTAGDKKFNDMPDDTCRVAWLLLITQTDREGRVPGDPAYVRSLVFPRRTDVSAEQMERYIQWWSDNQMIVWYETKGDKYICFLNFDKNQLGLRKDREPESVIPAPPSGEHPEDIRQPSGNVPEDGWKGDGLREEKGKEEKSGGGNHPYSGSPDIEAEAIYREVTKQITFPASEMSGCVNAIRSIEAQKGGKETTIDYLKPFYAAFQKRYSRSTRCFWLTDWAVTGRVPPEKKPEGPGEIRTKADLRKTL